MSTALLIRAMSVAAASLTLSAQVTPDVASAEFQVVAQRDATANAPSSTSISRDGRWLAFSSHAALLPSDSNGLPDIYVFDRAMKRLTLESALPDGTPSNAHSRHPDISDDGRFVVFVSSGHLTSADPQQAIEQVVLRDRMADLTIVLSANADGEPGNRRSGHPTISANGQIVAFESFATNLLAAPDANGSAPDVYAIAIATRKMARVSVSGDGHQPFEGASVSPAISADGQLVAFTSSARLDEHRGDGVAPPRERAGSTRDQREVFVRDLVHGRTTSIGRRPRGHANGSSYLPAIADDGRRVAFVSDAADLVPGDGNGTSDVFLHDLRTSTTVLVSRSVSGGTANGASTRPAISADGQLVAFESDASDLVCSRRCAPRDRDVNLVSDVFVFDRDRGVTSRLSADADVGWMEPSRSPALAAGGAIVAFSSRRPTDEHDRGDDFDLFVCPWNLGRP